MSVPDPRHDFSAQATGGAAGELDRTGAPPSTDPASDSSDPLNVPPTAVGSALSGPDPDQTIAFEGDEIARRTTSGRLGDGAGIAAEDVTVSFGDYSLIRKIASGGMGAVHLARQNSLHRTVALKTILAGQLVSEEHIQRFHQEAELAAQLDHPGIVPVYEVGEIAGQHYFSMAYVEGGTLADRVKDRPLPCREAAELVRQVALALGYAHQQGVIHRDLKPSNVLLDRDGHPKIADFGVAKLVSGISQLTLTGQVLGTPSFMAPEQAAGKTDEIGPLADLYSIGALLYCLITGRPPFQAATPVETLRQVMEQEPVSPRQLNAAVGQDLETICLKCLQKEPGKRYESAESLAEDLGRYLAGEPIRARPVGNIERLWRWCTRNKLAAVLLGGLVLSFVVGFMAVSFFAIRARREAASARASELRARDAQEFSERRWYAAEMGLAQQNWENGQTSRLRSRLKALRPPYPTAPDRRGFEWYYLDRLGRLELRTLRGHAQAVNSVAFSPDGRLLASAGGGFKRGEAGTLRISDSTTGETIHAWAGHAERANCVVFSPDGKQIASASGVSNGPGEVKVWDAGTARELRSLTGQTAQVWGLAFSPDGRRLAGAVGRFDEGGRPRPGDVFIWDLAGGAPVFHLGGHTGVVQSVAFSPDGRLLASADDYGMVKIWNAAQGKEVLTLEESHGDVLCVAFSPDGRRLAAACLDRMIRVWDASLWNMEGTSVAKPQFALQQFALQHKSGVRSLAFSPDSRRLAAGCLDHSVHIWDVTAQTESLTLLGHGDSVMSVAFSPDGWRLASASMDQTVKIWDATNDRKAFPLRDHKEYHAALSGIAFSPDGRWLAGAGQDRVVRVWDAASGGLAQTLQGPADIVNSVALSPDGRWLACGSMDRIARIWDRASGRLAHTFEGFKFSVNGVAFAPNNRWFACASGEWKNNGAVQVWDLATNKEVLSMPARGDPGEHPGFFSVAFSRDSRWLAAGCYDGSIQVWNLSTMEPTRTLRGHTSAVFGIAFSPDSQWLASASDDRLVKLWDVAAGQEINTLSGHTDRVMSVAFSPDGRRLASAGFERAVKLWDPRTAQEVFSLEIPLSRGNVAFAPDGRRLAIGGTAESSTDYTLAIWDARDSTPELDVQYEAESRVAFLFARPLAAPGVRDVLANDTSLSPAARERALALVDPYGEALARREAEDVIQRLHLPGLFQPELVERIRSDQSLSEPVRRGALALAATWVDCAGHLQLASRAVVRRRDAPAAEYQRALHQAEVAIRLTPHREQTRTTLGMAQYRTGQYREALRTLYPGGATLSDRSTPADVAFLGMAQWQLGQRDDALAALERLRTLLREPAWTNDGAAKEFLREFEEMTRDAS